MKAHVPQLESSPHSPQLEKKPKQQWKPSVAKNNKLINKIIIF